MKPPFIRSIRLDGFLSFAPAAEAVTLHSLNVIIGPNGSGKSNFLEAFSLLRTLSEGEELQRHLRSGGNVGDWLWKGQGGGQATIELELTREDRQPLRYRGTLAQQAPNNPVAVFTDEEFVEETTPDPTIYFRTADTKVEILTRFTSAAGLGPYEKQVTDRVHLRADRSLLAQRNYADGYPDTFWLGSQFAAIREFREWTFGRAGSYRWAQPTDMVTDALLPDASNLSMVVQELQHSGALDPVTDSLRRFLPRFERLTTRISGGAVMLYLHEQGLATPIPATRLSDGTLRFLSLVLTLFSPNTPALVTIEEPELGLHPDALAVVADLLVEASQRTQLVVTTHSDALLSHLSLEAESVMVCENIGGTRIRRLDGDVLKSWLEKYSLGEAWRMGAIGGNP